MKNIIYLFRRIRTVNGKTVEEFRATVGYDLNEARRNAGTDTTWETLSASPQYASFTRTAKP
jgi:hypothetical protein